MPPKTPVAGGFTIGGAGAAADGGAGASDALNRYPADVRKIASNRTNSMALTLPVLVPVSGPRRIFFELDGQRLRKSITRRGFARIPLRYVMDGFRTREIVPDDTIFIWNR